MLIIFTNRNTQRKAEKEKGKIIILIAALILVLVFVNSYANIITGFILQGTGYIVVGGKFVIHSNLYSNYTEQSLYIATPDQSIKLSAYWIANNTELDYMWLSTNETGFWKNHTVYSSPIKSGGTGNWSNFTWQNSSASGLIGWKIFANSTGGRENVTYEGTFTIISGVTLPEGIYYVEPSTPPVAGNYKYNFSIIFLGETAPAGDTYGCYVNQSNCYDDDLPGCKQIFVNKTISSPITSENVIVTYYLNETDSINSTLGGQTDNWIPWRIDRCGHYNSTMHAKQEYANITWRIHVHPLEWTTGDIGNSVNSKITGNMFMQNTIKGDNQGDVAYSVAKYGGTKVELYCHDNIDNPDDSDILADCDDPDCFGITYSCLPKQDVENESLYYSPSGSHGTLAPVIPEGDMGTNTSDFSAGFGETTVYYTMHQLPDGTFKMRFRHWSLSKTATIFVTGLPNITSVNKYFPGSGEANGEMVYFLDKNGDPRDQDSLNSTETYNNKVALRSYIAGGTEITNLDTIINVTFDQNDVDMSQGYVLNIYLNYVEGTATYEDIVHATIYFDNTTYPGGQWTSRNENESDIWVTGAAWGPCNDTKNSDFDLLNCAGSESICFDQKSYDCYDIDCDMQYGPSAWNDYTNGFTTGLCAYTNESQTPSMCFDGYNNDWRTEATSWGHANTGLTLVDCRDLDCNDTTNGTVKCNYDIELICNDGFDNDMYQQKDCDLFAGGTIEDAEYDCSDYCRPLHNNEEKGALCDDNIDNDWDKYYTTTGGANGYAINNTNTAGMDCAWGSGADEDCHLETMSSGYRCELGHELTCNDGFDNDYDNGHGQPNPGWTSSAYAAWFGITAPFVASADYNDYDCQNEPEVALNESFYAAWCFDGIDNDMDAYYRAGDNFVANSSTGKDCSDPDCIGVTNPANTSQICLEYEYNETDPFFANLSSIDYYCKNSIDDDADGPMDCNDPDCNKKFNFCYACPDNEMNDWDACADNFDNDYGDGTDEADPDCDYQLSTYYHQFHILYENNSYLCSDGYDNDQVNGADCADPNCNGIGICGAENCNDGYDNDGDGAVDCEDSDCDCKVGADMSGFYTPPTTSSATYGGVSVQYTSRVRIGNNFTFRMTHGTYGDANLYLGRLTGDGLPVGLGLQGELFSVTGPQADNFETQAYTEDTTHTQGQIEIADQIPPGGVNLGGFDITVNMPTNDTISSTTFEYYHAIDGSASTGNIITFSILENITPTVNRVVVSPGNGNIIYNDDMWVGVNATDVGSTIYRCLYNMTGPGGFFESGQDATDCKFYINNFQDDGAYTLNVWAEDDVGNLAPVNTTTHTINIIPEYLANSFVLGDRWYSSGDPVSVSAQFYTDDASSITTCDVYYQASAGSVVSAGTVPANNTGDRIECLGSITAPAADEMYGIWVNITDSEGDTVSSAKQTFYICSSYNVNGTGTNGEIWDCKFSDMNDDGIADYCKISTNSPPNIILLTPPNKADGIPRPVHLTAFVTDQDNDLLNVYFYEASGNLIGSNLGLTNGSTASYYWTGLDENEDYTWYANVTDGINTTQSSIWEFKTSEEEEAPVIGFPPAGVEGVPAAALKNFTVEQNRIVSIVNETVSSTEVIDIENTGATAMNIEAYIEKIDRLVKLNEYRFSLLPGERRILYLTIDVPEDIAPGIYIGKISFYSEGIVRVLRVTVIVTEYPELVIIKPDPRLILVTTLLAVSALLALLVIIYAYYEMRKRQKQ